MKKLIISFLIVFSFFPIIGDNIIQNANAAIGECQQFDEQVTYKIGILLLDIGEIDLVTGTYDATFWILISSDDVDLTQDPLKIDYVNGKNVNMVFERIDPDMQITKVTGDFFEDMNFKNHPFTSVALPIAIESAGCSTETVQFVVDESLSYVESGIYVPGWIEDGLNVKVEDYPYPGVGDFGRYTLTVSYSTPLLSSFLTGILPLLIVGVLAIVTFHYDPSTGFAQKGQIIATLVVATIFFQILSQMNQLPSLEYLTLQDKIFGVVYGLLLFSVIETFAQRKFGGNENKETGNKINKIFRYSLPILVIGTFLILWNF